MGIYVRQPYDCPPELREEMRRNPDARCCHNCKFFLNPDCDRYRVQVSEEDACRKDVCEAFADIFSTIPWRDYGKDQTD